MDIIVTYDISTATPAGVKRLPTVARICEQYGVRVQKSVFEARLGDAPLQRLTSELADTIDPSVDTVTIYRVPGALADIRTTLGRPTGHTYGRPWIL